MTICKEDKNKWLVNRIKPKLFSQKLILIKILINYLIDKKAQILKV